MTPSLTSSLEPDVTVLPEVVAGSPAATAWRSPEPTTPAEPESSGLAGLVADALAIPAAAFIPPRCAHR